MEKIRLASRNPIVFRDLHEAAVRDASFPVDGYLALPSGAHGARLPGVVISQGLGGVKDSRELRYAEWLAESGFATLVPDSFGARGYGDAIHTRRALAVTEAQILADAFAGLNALAGHPRVDPRRIAVMGFSYGGMTSVLAAYRQLQRLHAETFGQDHRFAAHASYYGCSVPRLEDPATTGGPVMMMLGEKDANVSIPRSREIAADLRRGGSEVSLDVLPGVYHQWDGNDEELRHVRFSLRRLAMRVDRENRIRDEKTGVAIGGRWRRGLVIALSVSPRGYHIKRDEKALRHSDDALLKFLSRSIGRAVGPPTLRAVSAPMR